MSAPLARLVSFNLHKFSYVTTASLNGPYPWSHLSPPALTVTFEETNSAVGTAGASDRVIRVHRDAHCLETIHLRIIRQQIDEDNSLAGTQELPDKVRKALILEHRPSIAVRYQLADRQFRRFQLNFLSTSDFDQAVHLLRESGLPVLHKTIDGRAGSRGSDFEAMRPSTGSQIASRSGSPANSLHYRADSLSAYQPSQNGSYGLRPSSQTSQWMFQGQQNGVKPMYGPSLVESTAPYRLQPDAATFRHETAPIYAQQMQNVVRHPGQAFSEYLYHAEDQRAPAATITDPIRRTLFSEPSSMVEPMMRPVSASARNDVLRPFCPPRRDLPFSKAASRPATSASNRLTGVAEASYAPYSRPLTNQDPTSASNAGNEGGLAVPSVTETSFKSTFWANPPAQKAARALSPAMSAFNRPYTRSVAASVVMEDEPPRKKPRPSYSRPTTAKSGTAKTTISKASKAAKPKQATAREGPIIKPEPKKLAAKKIPVAKDAEISTDSGRETVELLSTRQLGKTTTISASTNKADLSSQPVSQKVSAPRSSTAGRKTVTKPKDDKAAPEKKHNTSNPSAPPTTVPKATATSTEAQPPKPVAPKRKRTPAPKKPAVTYASVGIQTTPRADRFVQAVDRGCGTDTPDIGEAISADLRVAGTAPPVPIPSSALDVTPEWQALVEAFVLRHRDRVFARKGGLHKAAPPADTSAPDAESAQATADAAADNDNDNPTMPKQIADAAISHAVSEEEDDHRQDLERSVAACIMEPGFEALCHDVEQAANRLKADGAVGAIF